MDEKEKIIYGDWYVVKQMIWESWDSFLDALSALVMHTQRHNFSSLQYAAAIRHFSKLYFIIGETRLKKYMPNGEKGIDKDKKIEFIKDIYKKIIDGETIQTKDFLQAREYISLWLHKSGMDNIEADVKNPSDAVEENR